MDQQLSAIKKLQQDVADIDERVSQLENRCASGGDKSHRNDNADVSQFEEHLNKIERKQRENNLRLAGFMKREREDCLAIINTILRDERAGEDTTHTISYFVLSTFRPNMIF